MSAAWSRFYGRPSRWSTVSFMGMSKMQIWNVDSELWSTFAFQRKKTWDVRISDDKQEENVLSGERIVAWLEKPLGCRPRKMRIRDNGATSIDKNLIWAQKTTTSPREQFQGRSDRFNVAAITSSSKREHARLMKSERKYFSSNYSNICQRQPLWQLRKHRSSLFLEPSDWQAFQRNEIWAERLRQTSDVVGFRKQSH